MIKRKLEKLISLRLKDFPAVALLGPRQVGKTTLARTLSDIYYDLELEEEKLRLDLQWNELINTGELIILGDRNQTYDLSDETGFGKIAKNSRTHPG